MRVIGYTIWLVCALLVIASADTIPDPPAVTTHAVDVKAPCLRECAGNFYEPDLHGNLSAVTLFGRIRRLAFTNDHKLIRPSEAVVLTGQAADPSPPAV
jgi:hypothetical protein